MHIGVLVNFFQKHPGIKKAAGNILLLFQIYSFI